MAKVPENEDDLWIEGLNTEMKRVDQLFDDVPSPSMEGLQMLAVHTLERQRRRMRYEFMLFLLVASFIVGGDCWPPWQRRLFFCSFTGSE